MRQINAFLNSSVFDGMAYSPAPHHIFMYTLQLIIAMNLLLLFLTHSYLKITSSKCLD